MSNDYDFQRGFPVQKAMPLDDFVISVNLTRIATAIYQKTGLPIATVYLKLKELDISFPRWPKLSQSQKDSLLHQIISELEKG
jgi:hypothetical protein